MIRTTVASLRNIGLGLAACLAVSSLAVADDCSNWDVSITQPGVDGSIYAISALPNGDLVAGGLFTTIGGTDANSIARFDGASWHSMGDGMNGHVTTLEVLENGELIAAGNFTMAGGEAANRIARWDGENWHQLGDGVNSTVRALEVMPNGDLIAAGNFTEAGGMAANHIARFDGQQWHLIGGGVDGTVHAMEFVNDGEDAALYVGGEFITAGGVPCNHIARWDGENWFALDEGVNGTVTVLESFHDGDQPVLYVAGLGINTTGTVPLLASMASWDGVEWSPAGGGWRGNIRTMAVNEEDGDPVLYATIETPDGDVLARWDGWWWVPVSGAVDAWIHGITFADGELYVAGPGAGIARWVPCPSGPAETRHVPANYATIQAAIDAAEDGDTVLVAPGTYHEAINYLGKTIIVESSAGAEDTIIDATGLDTSVVTVVSGEGVGTVLRGFTITGGLGSRLSSGLAGGGILVTDATFTIDSCIIKDNGDVDGTQAGGGLFASTGSDTLVKNCEFDQNRAAFGGGALVLQNVLARFVESVFRKNDSSESGGGIDVNTNGIAVISHCLFEENHATTVGGGAGVGSIYPYYPLVALFEDCEFRENISAGDYPYGGGGVGSSNATFRRCEFVANMAVNGGGAAFYDDNVIITDSRFSNNSASELGGGIYLHHGSNGDERLISTTHFCGNMPQPIYGAYTDLGGNTFADSCEQVPSDLNDDGVVDVSDLLILLGAWGDCPLVKADSGSADCAADLNRDGAVDVSDLLILLANWN